MIYFILLKFIGKKKTDTIFLLGLIIYAILFRYYYIQHYGTLLILLDLYSVYKTSNNHNISKKIDIGKYKTLIRELYIKFNQKRQNKDINKYEEDYKPTNLNLEHTIKHTLNNVNKNI